MKTNGSVAVLLAYLAGAWLLDGQATAGILTGTQAPAPTTVNLTVEGTLDWTHWGLNTETDFDQKAGGANQISNFTQITGAVANTVAQFNDAAVAYIWSDGTPTTSAAGTTTGIYVSGLTNGFQFTVAADTTPRILRVYAGAWNAQTHFEATLSDGSASAYTDEGVDDSGAGSAAVYTIKFAANSAGQTLTIKVYSIVLHDPWGNCTLMGASLGTPPTGTGTLSGSDTFLPSGAVINLTSEGTVDWAHWGLATETDFNHKAGVAQKISDITRIGTFTQTGSAISACAWTDGTPTLTSSNTSAISVTGEGNGFQFTVPADTAKKVLRVYVAAYSARVHFEASLSDASAPLLSDDSFNTTGDLQGPVRVYSVTFAASGAGETLTVKCSLLADEGSGWVSLQAATLQALPAQTGTLGGGYTVLATASTVNLTTEGRIDWAHWGRAEPTDLDRKMGGTNVISTFSIIGLDSTGAPLEVQQFGDNFTAYSWTDGAPTLKATGTGSGIWLAQPGQSLGPGLNSGFEISVPADTTVRALKVYVGAYGSRMHFEAFLSDGSAPTYTDESFFNESDGPNRVYTLTFAAGSAGQKLIVRWWNLSLADTDWGNVTLQSAVLREAAPIVSLVSPANGSIFNASSGGMRFTASTIDPFSIAANQVGLALNGKDLSSSLVVSGTATARSASYTNLVPNQFYSGQIWAVDNLGHATTNFVTFDTFSTNGVVVIEAEDYNYDAGHFIDYPAPGAYAGFSGSADIDYHTGTGSGANDYRSNDPLQIPQAAETRAYFSVAGVQNRAVTGWSPDDWLNYTRTFAEGKYHVYLRYGALMDQSVQVGLVSSDRTQPDQAVTPVGTLITPQINSEAIYRYAALTDTSSNLVTVTLSGVKTLRLTGVDVSPAYGGLVADFLMLVPLSEQAQQPQLSISLSGGQVTVSFPTQAGATYILQYKDRFSDSSWQSVSPSVAGDGSVKSISQPAGQPSRFYRLSVM